MTHGRTEQQAYAAQPQGLSASAAAPRPQEAGGQGQPANRGQVPASPARPQPQSQPQSQPQASAAPAGPRGRKLPPVRKSAPAKKPSGAAARPAAKKKRTRRARLRLVQVDAWSVMKTAFLLSVALGIVTVVAVLIVWGVLGAAGVWNSVNSIVHQVVGSDSGKPFRIQDYLGPSRVMGITMILAVLDVVLITAIATLSAFLYNLAASLLGGVEVTLAEDH